MELTELDEKFSEIMNQYKQLMAVKKEMVLPIKSSRSLIEKIDFLLKEIKLNKEAKIRKLYLKNLKERLGLIKAKIKNHLEGDVSFLNKLNEIGLRKEDVEEIRNHIESFDVQEQAEEYQRSQESLFWRGVEAEEELKEAKKWTKKILKLLYNRSSLKSCWNSLSDYMKTVNFSKGRGSSERYGKVQIALRDFRITQRVKGEVMDDYLDIFVIGRIVGEEGLFGHQGHYLNTKNSGLPKFMKSEFGQVKVNSETLGKLGQLLTVDLMKQNKEVREEFSPIFDLLTLEEKFLDYKKDFRNFKSVIGDYLREVKNYKIEEIQDYIYKITQDRYYKSDFLTKKMKGFYSYRYHQKLEERISRWYYLYSSYLARKIYNRLSELSPQNRKKLISHLTKGFWVKNTFEEYVDHLFNRFS